MITSTFPISIHGYKPVSARFVDDTGILWWNEKLSSRAGIEIETIGTSRAVRSIYGYRIGNGPLHCSITAGAHADEPSGPMAACVLAMMLTDPAQDILFGTTFHICPQVNPDGAQANSPWFAPVPDLTAYMNHVKREGPGDDIEFGYPGNGKPALRPENQAVADFLAAGAPYSFHSSLHCMGLAQGAWFLIEKSWIERTESLRKELAAIAAQSGFGLHDMERNGDKGFTRIGRGFCTTPVSTAMQKHFLDAGDPEMAAKFHPSSMEYVKSLGGDPLAMVSEIPNFAIEQSWQPHPVETLTIDVPPPSPGETAYEKCRDGIKQCLASGDVKGAVAVAEQFNTVPVPFADHVNLQVQMVLAAVRSLQP